MQLPLTQTIQRFRLVTSNTVPIDRQKLIPGFEISSKDNRLNDSSDTVPNLFPTMTDNPTVISGALLRIINPNGEASPGDNYGKESPFFRLKIREK